GARAPRRRSGPLPRRPPPAAIERGGGGALPRLGGPEEPARHDGPGDERREGEEARAESDRARRVRLLQEAVREGRAPPRRGARARKKTSPPREPRAEGAGRRARVVREARRQERRHAEALRGDREGLADGRD